jgi:uncharacterized protein (DUF433 family)/tRNA A-37 threonylcarbamoyl transferase component Bud32
MTRPSEPNDRPNLRDDGLSVHDVLRRLADGVSMEDLLCEYPALQPADVRACLAYAAKVLAQAAPLPAVGLTSEWVLPAEEEPVSLPSSPAPQATTLQPPSEVGETVAAKRISIPGYEVLDKLGEGGMSVVYKARHLSLNRIVALKMILAGEHASEEMLARFALEAEAVAQLQHPGIVQIYEIGEHDGHSFLALEYVAGGSLAARLDDKPWPADKAAALVETLARSMQATHERGIIHRDLKPANVLLTKDDQPKIADFGLAKRLQDAAGRTRTGNILGTPEYMAPEQAAGQKDIGPAADVYALGGILYRLLTGRPPFQADSSLDTLMQVLEQEPVPVRQINRSAPRDLETIALKCLSKEPQKRYASAAELADDLQRFLEGESLRARRITARQRLFRWMLQRPGAALARGGLVVLILACVVGSASAGFKQYATVATLTPVWFLSLTAVLRTKLRPFLIGLSASLLLVAVSILWFWTRPDLIKSKMSVGALVERFVTVSILWFWWSTHSKTTYTIGSYNALGFQPINSATIACLLPSLIGLVLGRLASRRERILGACLVFLMSLLALVWGDHVFIWTYYALLLSIVIISGLYFGIICRIICWYCDGGLIDTVVGSFWGAPAGYFLVGLYFWSKPMVAFPDMMVIMIPGFGAVVGSVIGAYIGAMSGRKASRRRKV